MASITPEQAFGRLDRVPATFRAEYATDELGGPGDLLDLTPPAWHADAACKEADERITWFPTGKGPNAGAEAKRICATCLARAACLEWALEQGSDLDGVWGGLNQRERNRLRREQRAA